MKPIEDKLAVELLEANLSRGEAETIVLAKEMKADLVILDEKEAKKIAIMNNLNVVGTLGILRRASKMGRISDIIAAIDKLREVKFWIADKLYQQILEEEGRR